MGLRIHEEGNRYIPIVICDRCKERILEAKEGNYVWDISGETSLIMFEHKRCHRADSFYSGELSWLPIYLGNSLKVDWEKTHANIMNMEGIGA